MLDAKPDQAKATKPPKTTGPKTCKAISLAHTVDSDHFIKTVSGQDAKE